MDKKKILILGSTGSIGENAVKVALEHRERFEVVGVAAHTSVERLAEQANELNCKHAVIFDEAKFTDLKELLSSKCNPGFGNEALIEMVLRKDVDLVLCAIVGTAGLLPVINALKAGKDVALASKEVMVMAGDLVNAAAEAGNSRIIPVDSEHSAIFQCLQGRRHDEIARIILTASGGPFRDTPLEDMAKASWADAMAHPTWDMGPKVTIDSATMMNKALEIIEAGYLFGFPENRIETVIHRESIVHSMIELVDGSIIAQMSNPDMRFPIQYAMSYPERFGNGMPRLDFKDTLQLGFEPPDIAKFPSIGFAHEALKDGGTMPAVLNAANEVAVNNFRKERIAFTGIWAIIDKVMSAHEVKPQRSLKNVLAADAWARKYAEEICGNLR
ncbi:1-deoxy-D-xylulose-5-phosphate reductoisomerase [Lentisphaerota bacterium ZTH]|nr:1-deoxy-D-xylulose-5-phosphate reductoisomerase [Lentisphaerota bacterium]WET07207.1 1-deoxy-D-xylulose-5-phosphate reductoisomerase [Lentisphaerota bacterium ZTH]